MSEDNSTLQSTLSVSDFDAFYGAVHGRPPFSWQSELAEQACKTGWPDLIDLPTASGKTAVIDIAVFALAFQATCLHELRPDQRAARRIFFAVDRRLIVNQAFLHGRHIATELWKAASDPSSASHPVLCCIASALQSVNGSGEHEVPLDCYELRGGIPRDDAWVRSPTQPTIITTTVDQLGSRMLFRGYGVSDRNLPIHAALTTNDTLVLLDEAHCSVPFGQTIDSIQRYRGPDWSQEHVETPFRFVPMTATPTNIGMDANVFRLEDRHYATSDALRIRHECAKPVRLVLEEKAKGKNKTKHEKIAKRLVTEAVALARDASCRRIAIVANRVAVAKEAYRLLQVGRHDADLMIGRMRPIDRDRVTDRLNEVFRCNPSRLIDVGSPPKFLVATQTIEVGADFDFDAMVSQCASLDALKQRFGRLNRLGNFDQCYGVVVAAAGDLAPEAALDEAKPLDPIYGNSLALTWHRVSELSSDSQAAVVDFGVRSEGSIGRLPAERTAGCSAPSRDALVLMPAHVDMLCQTMPKPSPDPDISMYLHGVPKDNQQASSPTVRLCWRSDLQLPDDLEDLHRAMAGPHLESAWTAAVDVCPPSTGECMSVPKYLVQAWLNGKATDDDSSDVDGEHLADADQDNGSLNPELARYGLVWRGAKATPDRSGKAKNASFIVGPRNGRRIADDDCIVIPAAFGGWQQFGHVPESPIDPSNDWNGIRQFLLDVAATGESEEADRRDDYCRIDIADEAFERSRAKTIFRVHNQTPYLAIADQIRNEWSKEFSVATNSLSTVKLHQLLEQRVAALPNSAVDQSSQPSHSLLDKLREHGREGVVKRYPGGFAWISSRHATQSGMPPLPSSSFDDELDSRSGNVQVCLSDHLADACKALTDQLEKLSLSEATATSLAQAAIWHDIGKADPRFQANLRDMPLSQVYMQRKLLAKSGGYGQSRHASLPTGFRHEFLSVAILPQVALAEKADCGLVRYLIATHHGFARPFGPACVHVQPTEIDLRSLGGPLIPVVSPVWQQKLGHLATEIGDDFWRQNRRFGPWGVAYYECLLRLADWRASGYPSQQPATVELAWSKQTATRKTVSDAERVFPGMEAGNPLGFLSAIGLFRVLETIDSDARFAWRQLRGGWSPLLVGDLADLSVDELLARIDGALATDTSDHPALTQPGPHESVRDRFQRFADTANREQRLSADWLTCESSDGVIGSVISQLQTSRRDYHAIAIGGLLAESQQLHLHRTLFRQWDYADPIAGVSLHLEPREDRRHAYQWHTPSGDPTRKVHGGMIGANRLALEAWPMFQSLPDRDRLRTTGFHGRYVSNTALTWPVWTEPVTLDCVRSILALAEIQRLQPNSLVLESIGVKHAYRSSRILVGKTPNLTPAALVSCG